MYAKELEEIVRRIVAEEVSKALDARLEPAFSEFNRDALAEEEFYAIKGD